MEKTKDMILVEKLRKASHGMHGGRHAGPHGMGMPPGPGMPPPPPGMMPPPPGIGAHPGPGCRTHGPGMFPRERILLVVLDAGDDGLRQKDIAERLGFNAPTITEHIDRLESEHYLERCANPNDKRSTLIRLTEKGRARAYEVADERKERAAEYCKALSEDEKDTLIALLDKLLKSEEG